MHLRNIHKQGYDFSALCQTFPSLASFLRPSTKGKISIDFADPKAVKYLNAALLKHHYAVDFWDIPEAYLCPAVPGRADYIHHIADLLDCSINRTKDKTNITGLDIGTGANLIYPIIGAQVYGWKFIASDIEQGAFKSAKAIVKANSALNKRIRVKLQNDKSKVFEGIVGDTYFDFSMCNPPFHSCEQEAIAGNIRKLKGLKHNQNKRKDTKNRSLDKAPALNFGGQSNELWCKGGELGFVSNMIRESASFAKQVGWFTCLISKRANLDPLTKLIDIQQAKEHKTVTMQQGNKTSRFIAWRY
ncbi:23S rRNA (adenine(1618)-N(6))-methyltransferase RlmF [Ningiella sp. W23]|uniref:23S rRNA (adenine(1618)-N(6))-methyltransferase RlmF n=1 Tax=Ningiella sp. W23 TaxID=3023715 RepID=UPI0037577CAA